MFQYKPFRKENQTLLEAQWVSSNYYYTAGVSQQDALELPSPKLRKRDAYMSKETNEAKPLPIRLS